MLVLYIVALVCGLAIIGLDQLTKYFIVSSFTLRDTADFINGFIAIHYRHKRGAA